MSQAKCLAIYNGLTGDAIAFLRKNIIFTADMVDDGRTTTGEAEDTLPESFIRRYNVKKVEAEVGTDIVGNRIEKIYSLREDQGGHLEAHYLPWNNNAEYQIVLDVNTGPPLFFTGMLSGCGVGFVEAPDQSTVRFSHHNKRREKSPDTELAKSLASTQAKLLPNQYQNAQDTGYAHVHGVRRGNRWQFYVQKITMNRNRDTFRIIDVYEFEKPWSFCTIL